MIWLVKSQLVNKSMMSKASEGFIPKHLRKPDEIPIDIDKLISSTSNSRKQSEEMHKENSVDNLQENLKEVADRLEDKVESSL